MLNHMFKSKSSTQPGGIPMYAIPVRTVRASLHNCMYRYRLSDRVCRNLPSPYCRVDLAFAAVESQKEVLGLPIEGQWCDRELRELALTLAFCLCGSYAVRKRGIFHVCVPGCSCPFLLSLQWLRVAYNKFSRVFRPLIGYQSEVQVE